MGGSRNFLQGRVLTKHVFISHQRFSQMAVRTSLEEQLDPRGPIASRGGSILVFLRKPIATCDSPGGVPDP